MSYSIVLVSAALTVVFVRGTLFDAFRRRGPDVWRELCSCALCMGVWVGGGVGALELWHAKAPVDLWFAFAVLTTGATTGVVAWLVVSAENYLDSTAAQRDAVAKTLLHLPRLTEKAMEIAQEQRERDRELDRELARGTARQEPRNEEESRA